jgi:hypothetical protein
MFNSVSYCNGFEIKSVVLSIHPFTVVNGTEPQNFVFLVAPSRSIQLNILTANLLCEKQSSPLEISPFLSFHVTYNQTCFYTLFPNTLNSFNGCLTFMAIKFEYLITLRYSTKQLQKMSHS